LTYDFHFQSQASYGRDPHTHKQKLKFKGQSDQKIEWKEMDGETDRQILPVALPSRLMRSVEIKVNSTVVNS